MSWLGAHADTETAYERSEGATPVPRKDFLTLADFLEEMDVPKSTFFRWKAVGQAPRTYKLPNRQIRIRRSDFESWLKSREE